MPSLRARLFRWVLKPLGWMLATVKPGPLKGRDVGLPDFVLPSGVSRKAYAGEPPGERLAPKGADPAQRAILYLHGGGYVVGSPASHRGLTARLAKAADTALYAPRYRLAPQFPCPAALDDALNAWNRLREDLPAEQIAVAGDSAGGGLALALLQALRDRGEDQPGCAVTFSAWADLTASGRSIEANARRDTLLTARAIRRGAQAYAGLLAQDDPRASPLFGRFDGLAPLLMWVSGAELLLDDTLRVAAKAQGEGVPVRVERREGLPHAWPVFAGFVPEAEEAISKSAAFIRDRTDGSDRSPGR